MKKIGFLTSGGDSPGMNACIRAIVKSSLNSKIKPIAIYDGYKGMIENHFKEMKYDDVNNIIQLGGTIIGTARSEEFKIIDYRKKAIQNLQNANIEGLIVIGGDGTFTGATILSKEMNIPIIGVPATIDNDIYGTDNSIGFDTALNTVVEAIDKIRDTASSHHRIFFIEVMGRNSGFIALHAAIAGGAESVLIPEITGNLEHLAKEIKNKNKGKRSTIVIVAEGEEKGGAFEIMKKLKPFLVGYDLRSSVLGHIQRGGKPSALDRIISTKMGAKAVDLLSNNKTDLMVCYKNQQISTIPIIDGISKKISPMENEDMFLLEKMLTLE
ncbi:MAG: 6-phosphofructokinase [Flavobacteriia bacterium]|nr:6-phosphofructokinase [Flavobacteriia bacterium]